jgi:hypothetical protein
MVAELYVIIGEAEVEEKYWEILAKVYEDRRRNLPEGLVESHLLQRGSISNRWRIISIWKSKQFYEQSIDSVDSFMCKDIFGVVGGTTTVLKIDKTDMIQLLAELEMFDEENT